MIFVLWIKNYIYLCNAKGEISFCKCLNKTGKKMRYSGYLLHGLIIDILTIFFDRK